MQTRASPTSQFNNSNTDRAEPVGAGESGPQLSAAVSLAPSPRLSQRSSYAHEASTAPSDDQLHDAASNLRRDTNAVLSGIDDPDLNAAARRLRSSVLECADALVRLRGAYNHESRSREQLQKAVADLRARLKQAYAATQSHATTVDIDGRSAVSSQCCGSGPGPE